MTSDDKVEKINNGLTLAVSLPFSFSSLDDLSLSACRRPRYGWHLAQSL